MMQEEVEIKKRSRGKGVKPAMAHINLRIPQKAMDFYRQYPNFSAKMRSVLSEYAEKHASEEN